MILLRSESPPTASAMLIQSVSPALRIFSAPVAVSYHGMNGFVAVGSVEPLFSD